MKEKWGIRDPSRIPSTPKTQRPSCRKRVAKGDPRQL